MIPKIVAAILSADCYESLLVLRDCGSCRLDDPDHERETLLPKEILLVYIVGKRRVPLVVGGDKYLKIGIGDGTGDQLVEVLSCHQDIISPHLLEARKSVYPKYDAIGEIIEQLRVLLRPKRRSSFPRYCRHTRGQFCYRHKSAPPYQLTHLVT